MNDEEGVLVGVNGPRREVLGNQAHLRLTHVRGAQRVDRSPSQQVFHADDPLTAKLQKEFSALLKKDSRLRKLVDSFEEKEIPFVVLGGWVRDSLVGIMRGKLLNSPKDIDFVVTGIKHNELAGCIEEETTRTIFGGVSLAASGTGGIGIDVWSAEETYLVERFSLNRAMEQVLSVTDFNVNAATFRPRQRGLNPQLTDAGCINGLRTRTLRFHFEWVPYPEVQVARILNIATKVGLSLDQEVQEFVQSIGSTADAQRAVRDNLRKHCDSFHFSEAEKLFGEIGADTVVRRSKSRLYANALGVFEGGGVRGAAFAGAYESARDAGMHFSKVAGTSAGSIAAAFVATGAASKWIVDELVAVDMAVFQERLDHRQELKSSCRWVPLFVRKLLAPVQPLMKHFGWGGLAQKLDVYLYAGSYSSKAIELWVEDCLRRLLRVNGLAPKGRDVRFSDLPIPLTIVASDISNCSYKIWSSENSPDESVAFAARCSSSIPLFFQPVLRENGVFVDGGLLANAPTFVFREEAYSDSSSCAPRLVTFRLVQRDVPSVDLSSAADYFDRLGATVVDGASEIQGVLQPGRFDIEIDTGAIGSTDFEKVTASGKRDLVDAGRDAVRRFVENEETAMRSAKDLVRLVGRDQQSLFLVRLLSGVPREVVMIDRSAVWLHLCFPSFLHAIRAGTRVRYVCEEQSSPDEAHRRKLFELMGGIVEYVEEIPFKGVVANPGTVDGLALVCDDTYVGAAFEGEVCRVYSHRSDPKMFEMTQRVVDALRRIGPSTTRLVPSLEFKVESTLLKTRILSVPQYQGAQVSVGEVRLDHGLRTLQPSVKEYKYIQAEVAVGLFRQSGCDLFDACAVDLANEQRSLVTPPVIEISGRETMIVKGHARALFALRSGVESIKAVIVEGPQNPLPFSGKRLVDLAIESRTRTRGQQYPNVDEHAWRQIEQAVHPVREFE